MHASKCQTLAHDVTYMAEKLCVHEEVNDTKVSDTKSHH